MRTATPRLVLATMALVVAHRVVTTPASETVTDPPDPFCTTLRALVEAAGPGFVSLRGAPKKDAENTWAATRGIPGASGCLVFGGTPAAYTCTLYAGDAANDAAWAYDDAVARAKKCLGDGWTASEQVSGVRDRTTIVRGSAPASVRVVSSLGSGDAYLVELWLDARVP